jgi:hypothetical protein
MKDRISITEKDGITWIQNPEKPLEKEIQNLSFVEVFRLGADPEDVHQSFYRITHIQIDKHRNLYISETGYPRVQQFDANGQFIQNFGCQGQGPGEYIFPSRIMVDDYDQILVFDGHLQKIIWFNEAGMLVSEWKIGNTLHKPIQDPQIIQSSKILCCICESNRDHQLGENVYRFITIGPELSQIDDLFFFRIPRHVIIGNEGSVISKDKWNFHAVVSPDNRIYVVNSSKYEMDVYDEKGIHIYHSNRAYKSVPLTRDEIKARKNRGASVDGKYLPVPDYYDDIQAIVFPCTDECWVIPSRKRHDRYFIDVFDKQGEFIRQYDTKLSLTLGKTYNHYRMRWLKDEDTKTLYLWQIEKDEEGIEQVVCYRASLWEKPLK